MFRQAERFFNRISSDNLILIKTTYTWLTQVTVFVAADVQTGLNKKPGNERALPRR